jgi:subtilisin
MLLREALLPEITPLFTEWNEVLLEAGRPAVLGVRVSLLMLENTLRLWSAGPDHITLLGNQVVPWLEPYAAASYGPYTAQAIDRREYVVLPDRGVRLVPEDNSRARGIFEQMHTFQNETTVTIDESPDVRMFVLDSISPLEPKLVRMGTESANALQGLHLGLRVEPMIRYEMAAAPSFKLNPVPGANPRVTIKVVCAATGNAVEGAEVVAIMDWKNQYGESGTTDIQGNVHLPLGGLPVQLDRLYVKPPARGHWGAYRSPATIVDGYSISLAPVDPTYADAVRQIYGAASLTDGQGVRVAVIDCGVGPHPDLVVAGGRNVVRGEQGTDIADNGDGHGTHVAGIIAGRGSPRGVAPGVELYSYRVVGTARQAPDNFLILKALIYACDDGCEIANLSMGLDQSSAPHDETLKRAIEDARDRGCVVIAAAGNHGKKPVTRLAKYTSAEGLAISAIGRKGTFPRDSLEASDIEPNLSGSDPNDFVAEFSSFGDDVSLTAPGVGTISTAPNGGYRPWSGTSMAAPVVAGLIARIIEQNTPPLPPAPDRARAGEILSRTVKAAKKLGFPREREGAGLPR